MWFKDDEVYEYPYCAKDTDYFTPYVLDDHSTDQDDGRICSAYEHRSVNYGRCLPNAPGFVADMKADPTTAIKTMTSTPVNTNDDNNYFLVMENDGDYGTTGLTLEQCPQHTNMFQDEANAGYSGAGSVQQACRIREAGNCRFDSSNYCIDGGEFMCPAGTSLSVTAPGDKPSDCVACTSANYCSDGGSTTCPSGYVCPDYTNDAKSYPL